MLDKKDKKERSNATRASVSKEIATLTPTVYRFAFQLY
jgi:hypothetical protein